VDRDDADARGMLSLPGGSAESRAPFERRLRADAGWDWTGGRIQKAAILSETLGQQPQFQALGHITDSGEVLPLGLILLVQSYRWPREPGTNCTFVWYLSDSPESAQIALGLRPFKRIGRTLIDIASCLSFSANNGGRLLLHADIAGGDRLTRWYRESLGMKQLEPEYSISPFRKNDGRYFYFESGDAESFLASSDQLRRQS
jgi:hypothetical protein